MTPLWLIPISVALLLVPAMFGIWAWSEVVERIREESASLGPRTRWLRVALIVTSATYLVGAGTWSHPTILEHVLTTSLRERLLLYTLLAIPLVLFGVIGLLARNGRTTGLRAFLAERDRNDRRLRLAGERSRTFLDTLGADIARELDRIDARMASLEHAVAATPPPAGITVATRPLRDIAAALIGEEPTRPAALDLDAQLSAALEEVRDLAARREVAVYRSGLEGCGVVADPRRLHQVLTALFEVALERTPLHDGLVQVGITDAERAGMVTVTIRDNGSGSLDFPLPLVMARQLARQDGGDVRVQEDPASGPALALDLVVSRARGAAHAD